MAVETTIASDGKLRLLVEEEGKSGPLPCRVHLRGSDGQSVRHPRLPSWDDHFVCEGEVEIDLPAGEYRLVVERGPEYTRGTGAVVVAAGETRREVVRLRRRIDMAKRGWWSGETHVHRPPQELRLHLRAEDLHVAPVLTIWNRRNRWRGTAPPAKLTVEVGPDRIYHLLSAEDERQGGALFFHNLATPLEFGTQGREYPSPVANLEAARRQPNVRVEIEKPFWWDVPTWIATGEIDLIGLANNHMCRSRMYENEAWGRPRDEKRLPPPRGNGFFTQELYYRILNCGHRIPPSAGSASGVLPNPVGYNRVYVSIDGAFSRDAWWRRLLAGRSFVTNGPMLLATANGKNPGEVFRGARGLSIEIAIDVDSNDPLETVEVIRDGEIAERLPVEESARSFRKKVSLQFDASGWFLVRAICAVEKTFRFASSAPWYVEVDGTRSTVHRRDVQFFLDWIDDRTKQIRAGAHEKLDGDLLREVLAPHERARKYYERLLDGAR